MDVNLRIGIPQSIGKQKRSIEVINEILFNGNCKIIKRVHIKDKGWKVEAKRNLNAGRLHIMISCRRTTNKYALDIHFDPYEHFGNFHGPHAHSLQDCAEIRDFVSKYVTPTIQKYR